MAALHSCAVGAVTALLRRNSVRATAAAISASMVAPVHPLKMGLAGADMAFPNL